MCHASHLDVWLLGSVSVRPKVAHEVVMFLFINTHEAWFAYKGICFMSFISVLGVVAVLLFVVLGVSYVTNVCDHPEV